MIELFSYTAYTVIITIKMLFETALLIAFNLIIQYQLHWKFETLNSCTELCF